MSLSNSLRQKRILPLVSLSEVAFWCLASGPRGPLVWSLLSLSLLALRAMGAWVSGNFSHGSRSLWHHETERGSASKQTASITKAVSVLIAITSVNTELRTGLGRDTMVSINGLLNVVGVNVLGVCYIEYYKHCHLVLQIPSHH